MPQARVRAESKAAPPGWIAGGGLLVCLHRRVVVDEEAGEVRRAEVRAMRTAALGLGVGEALSQTGQEQRGQVDEGPGFVGSVCYFPARAITVAVVSNGEGNVSQVADTLADTALGGG